GAAGESEHEDDASERRSHRRVLTTSCLEISVNDGPLLRSVLRLAPLVTPVVTTVTIERDTRPSTASEQFHTFILRHPNRDAWQGGCSRALRRPTGSPVTQPVLGGLE